MTDGQIVTIALSGIAIVVGCLMIGNPKMSTLDPSYKICEQRCYPNSCYRPKNPTICDRRFEYLEEVGQ